MKLWKNTLSEYKNLSAWIIILSLILVHIIPYTIPYSLPIDDYVNLITVINFLNHPESYGQYQPFKEFISWYTTTTPIYFYGIVYPISLISGSKGSLLTLGSFITIFSVYFAGMYKRNWKGITVAILVLILLLHAKPSPLYGNKRSFTAFFLLGALWAVSKGNFWSKLALIGLAAGIYPPIALLIIGFFLLVRSAEWLQGKGTILEILLDGVYYSFVFLIVLTPYLSDLSGSQEIVTQLPSLHYNFYTLSGFIESLFSSRSGLFKLSLPRSLFFMSLLLALLQYGLIQDQFRIKKIYFYMGLAALVSWIFANLTHPLIYHPFKYTRLTFTLLLIMIFAENLKTTVETLENKFAGNLIEFLTLVSLCIFTLIIWSAFVFGWLNFSNFDFFGKFAIKAVLSLPLFFLLSIYLPHFGNSHLRALISSVILFCFIFLPHCYWSCGNLGGRLNLTKFGGLYNSINQTPPKSLVAGPPYLTHTIKAFGKRPTYTNRMFDFIESQCERITNFWQIYISNSRKEISEFLKDNRIQYLLVDRKYLPSSELEIKLHSPNHCNQYLNVSEKPFLDRHFDDAIWQLNKRYYLLESKTLK